MLIFKTTVIDFTRKEYPSARGILLERANRKLVPEDRISSLSSYILLEKEFMNIGLSFPWDDIKLNKYGKPYIDKKEYPFFSISHSYDRAAVAISDKRVGIDIQKISPCSFKIAERFFSNKEREYLFSIPEEERDIGFTRLFSLKESYLKALGTGFYSDGRKLDLLPVLLQKEKSHMNVLSFHEDRIEDYVISVIELEG